MTVCSINGNVVSDAANSLLEWEVPMDILTLQDFFFRAMVAGYASGAEPQLVPSAHGWKCMPPFVDEVLGLELVDMWCTHPQSDRSFGFTTIYLHGQPVWVMSYGGEYRDEAIPILKKALRDTYEAKVFLGARGASMSHEGLAYSNTPAFMDGDDAHSFAHFQGCEEVFRLRGDRETLGSHEYWGMSLIDLDDED